MYDVAAQQEISFVAGPRSFTRGSILHGLGADNPRLLRLVVGEGARLIALGISIGVPATWAATRAVRPLLVGIESVEPLTVGSGAVLLAVVALAACNLSAGRVLGIQPARLQRD